MKLRNFFRKLQQETRAEDTSCIMEFLGFNGSNSISRTTALQIPTVSACISKISDTVSRLPVKLYRQDTDGRITEICSDKRIKLLNADTNDTLSPVDMWRACIEDYYLGDGAWIYINRNNRYEIVSLNYVDCRKVSVMQNEDPIFKTFNVTVNGERYYDFQFIRLMRKTKDGFTNIPLQEENSSAFLVAYNALMLEKNINSKGGRKSGFFKSKTSLAKDALEAIQNAYDSIYSNNDNKIAVLNSNLDFQELSSTSAELQLNEAKKSNSVEICKLFDFPHTIIDGGASDDDNKKFVSTVVSLLNQIETALDMFLLTENEKKNGYYFAFDTKELTRGNLKERFEAYDIAVRNRILQIDEIRKEEDYKPLGMNFVTLGLGDVLLDTSKGEIYIPNTNQTMKIGDVKNDEN